jgi:hypothetical protein
MIFRLNTFVVPRATIGGFMNKDFLEAITNQTRHFVASLLAFFPEATNILNLLGAGCRL